MRNKNCKLRVGEDAKMQENGVYKQVPESYNKLLAKYSDFLSTEELSDIWKVSIDTDNTNPLPLAEEFAVELIQHKLDNPCDNNILNDTSNNSKEDIAKKGLNDLSKLLVYNGSLCRESDIKEAWETAWMVYKESKQGMSINPDEVLELAVVIVLDCLEPSEQSYLSLFSCDEDLVDFVVDVFNKEIPSKDVLECLEMHRMNAERAINTLRQDLLFKSQMSYASVFKSNIVCDNNNNTICNISNNNNNNIASNNCNNTTTSNSSKIIVLKSDEINVINNNNDNNNNRLSSSNQLVEHFKSVFEKNNPGVVVQSIGDFIEFFGFNIKSPTSNPISTCTCRLDLHGLTVSFVLKLLDSLIRYYYEKYSPHSNNNNKNNENNKNYNNSSNNNKTKTSVICVSLIVGKGIHSQGGKSRLAPAVKNYLRQKNMKFISQDGIVIFSVHI